MEEEVQEEADLLTPRSQLCQTNILWKQEFEQCQSQVETLEAKLMGVKACIKCSEEDAKKELEVLWRRVRASASLLSYLKSKAKIMAVPHLAHTSCGIRHQEGVGLIDRNGAPLSDWSKDVDLSLFENPSSVEETLLGIRRRLGSFDEHDEAYISEIFKSVRMVIGVMEALVKRVILAEMEANDEKEKVNLGQDEIKKKALQIEGMSAKVEEMEKFAVSTNCILNEMQQKVEDMVQETSRQRQRAAENEQELCRVKQDFESLRSYVGSLIIVRETLISSEKQFQTMERLFERLVAKTTHLESEKMLKEAEVQKLMAENVRLSSLLDKKEAQLLAMNEQCKVMALSSHGI